MSAKSIMQQAAPRSESYHLAMSSDIGHAAICGLKFKLPRVMGVIPEGNESFIPGFIAHNVLESISETIVDLWRTSPTPSSQEIMKVWNPNMQRVFADIREKQLGSPENNIEQYISQGESSFVYRNPGRIQNIAYSLLGEDMYDFTT